MKILIVEDDVLVTDHRPPREATVKIITELMVDLTGFKVEVLSDSIFSEGQPPPTKTSVRRIVIEEVHEDPEKKGSESRADSIDGSSKCAASSTGLHDWVFRSGVLGYYCKYESCDATKGKGHGIGIGEDGHVKLTKL